MSLTELAIRNAKPQKKPYKIADSGGLCIEISPSGGKLWRWRYRFNDKEQMLALGKWPSVPPLFSGFVRFRRQRLKSPLLAGFISTKK